MDEAIDLARQKILPFRVNRGQVIDFSITANNADGTPYDFTGHTAEMYVYNSFAKTDTPEYTIGVVLSSGTIVFSHAAITRRREDFVYQLWITDASGYRQVLTNGPFLVLNREWDHEDGEDTIIISLNGDNVTLTITPLSGGGGGSGDVVGPASSVDSNFAAFDGTDGKTIKDSGVNAGSFQAALGFTPVPNTRTILGLPLSGDITKTSLLNAMGLFTFRSGLYYSNNVNQENTTTHTLAANNLRAFPWFVPHSLTFDQILLEVVTLAGSTTARICIYADNGSGYPGDLIANSDTGTFTTSSTGVKTNNTSSNVLLPPGWYHIAINSNGGPVVRGFFDYASGSYLGWPATMGTAGGYVCWAVTSTYAAMPDPFPAGAALNNTLMTPLILFHAV